MKYENNLVSYNLDTIQSSRGNQSLMYNCSSKNSAYRDSNSAGP